jgi:hypothetical protein
MGIISIVTNTAGQAGANPRRVKIITTDSLATVTTAGYLTQVHNNGYPLLNTDVIDMDYLYNPLTKSGTYGVFNVTVNGGNVTLSQDNNEGGVLLPVTDNHVAVFNGTSGQIRDSGNTGIFTSSSFGQSIIVTEDTGSSTAIRCLYCVIAETAPFTSGVLAGFLGSVETKGVSGGSIYGVQGKVISVGSIGGTASIAGVFGQLDLSAATGTGNITAAIWGDMGIGGAGGTLLALYGIALTNNSNYINTGQLYLHGGATNLLDLADNSGTVGATYFVPAGTGAGSAGDITRCNASKVLKIRVNGVSYWLPLFASNS